MASPDSITGQYLVGMRQIPIPLIRRIGPPGQILRVLDARGNNLKGITAEIPLGTFCCVTGVSGGGKSTLIVETLYKALAKRLNNAREQPAPLGGLEGVEFLDKIVDIDQSRSAGRRARTRRPIPAASHRFATGSRGSPRRSRAAICPAASRSTSRAGAAKPARATV